MSPSPMLLWTQIGGPAPRLRNPPSVEPARIDSNSRQRRITHWVSGIHLVGKLECCQPLLVSYAQRSLFSVWAERARAREGTAWSLTDPQALCDRTTEEMAQAAACQRLMAYPCKSAGRGGSERRWWRGGEEGARAAGGVCKGWCRTRRPSLLRGWWWCAGDARHHRG
jgi:hypothetical protein